MNRVDENWRNRPTTIDIWPPHIDYVLAIDENGTPDLKYLRKCLRKDLIPERNHYQFTVTGACFTRAAYIRFKSEFDRIKHKYWANGLAEYRGMKKKVCLHYSEIYSNEHPFNIVEFEEFIGELNDSIKKANCQIFSCSMDKLEHVKKQGAKAYHPYNLSMGFILERFCHMINRKEQKGIIMIESRRNKDKDLLKHLLEIIEKGNYPNPPEHFRNIQGVFFNPKWRLSDNNQSTYSILEYTDYVSRLIHDHVYYDSQETFSKFQMIEPKLYKPWGKYDGWGLKIFPEKIKTASVELGG